MASFDRLSALDCVFLDLETERAPMTVGWTMRFRGEAPSVGALREAVEGRLDSVPRLRRRLAQPAFGLGDAHWVDDPGFSITNHVGAIHLVPAEGPRRLEEIAGRLLSEPLDRERPLWRLQLVTGLEPGGFAIVGQAHHALVDGVAAIEIATVLFDGAEPVAAPVPWQPAPEPSTAEMLTASALSRIGAGGDVATTVARSLASGADTVREALSILATLVTPMPSTALERSATSRRTVATVSAEIGPIREAVGRHGATLNDALLAASSVAVGRALARRGEEPDHVRVLVPADVRDGDEGAATHGNRISILAVELPLGRPDLERTLKTVRARTRTLKSAGHAGALDAAIRSAELLPAPVRSAAVKATATAAHFTLVISNVPGPEGEIGVLGRELEAIWPAVPLVDGHSLSIGAVSYGGRLHVGCYGDAALVPDIEQVAADLAAALDELSVLPEPEETPWRRRARERRAAHRAA
jgi:diacylglycerol O-acyltransferase